MFILNLIIFLIVLGIIITIHEFGHFYFAKKADILCHEFSIGMGPVVYQKTKGETKYSIRLLPLGGYVSMAGETSDEGLLKKGIAIGLKFDDQNKVRYIVNEGLEAEVTGTVVSYDLYGENMSPLYIELETNGEVTRYDVLRNAQYELKEKQYTYIEPQEKSYSGKKARQKFWTVFAGPMMNFLLAFIIYFVIAIFVWAPQYDVNQVGSIKDDSPAALAGIEKSDRITHVNSFPTESFYDIASYIQVSQTARIIIRVESKGDIEVLSKIAVQSIGITNYNKEGVLVAYDDVTIQSIGARSGGKLEIGDRIVSLDGIVIHTWDDVISFFREESNRQKQSITFSVIRDQKQIDNIQVETLPEETLKELNTQALVLSTGLEPTQAFEFGYFITYPFKKMWSDISQMGTTLYLLFKPSSQVGVGDLSGFVGIFSLVERSASQGFLSLLVFTAFISINIGLLNLLPIPALDGGRLVFIAYEGITKRKVNRKVEGILISITFILLFALLIFVTFEDIKRLIQGVF